MQITKNILKYCVLGGLFATPFIAFIVPSAMFFPFIVGKGFAFRILTELIFGLYLILAFLSPEYRPKMSWITKSVLIFALAILVADLLGVNIYKSLWSNYERMEGFVLIFHLVLYYMVASSVFRTTSRWNQFFNTSILASLIMSLYGVFQLMGKIAINQGGVRVDATFGNSSYLAIYLVLHIFLCLYMMASGVKQKWLLWAYGGVAILETGVLYFTATRGAILGLIGGLFITGLLLAWKEKENKKLKKAAYWTLGLVILLVIGFVSIRNASFVKKSPVLSRFSTLGISEFKNQGRYFVWPMALKGVADNPIFGWGQENFNFVFNKYYDPGMFGQEEWFDRTHNVVLDWLIAGGIVGFLSYVGMYVAMFYYLWRKNSPLSALQKSIFTGMIIAYIFHNIFVFDNLISYTIFFFLLAYIHSESVKNKEGFGKFYTKTFSPSVTSYVVGPIILILTIAGVYFINIPAILANRTLIQAVTPQKEGVEKNFALFKKIFAYNSFGSGEAVEQLIQITSQIASPQVQVSESVKKEFYDLAKLKIEEKIAENPHDARYLVFAGSFFNRFGQYDEAIKYLEKALVESPKKQSIYFELGSSYLGKRDLTKMFELFKKAYELKPTAMESKVVYTIGAIYAKNTEALKEMSPFIDQKTIVSDNRFLKAYADIGDFNSVIAILNVRIQNDPTNVQYKLSLASAYATIGQKQKAIDILNAIIRDNPSFKDQGEIFIKQIQSS